MKQASPTERYHAIIDGTKDTPDAEGNDHAENEG
jgi:hypothetical protein